MRPLADLSAVDGVYDAVARSLERPGGRVCVTGRVGSGHRALAFKLKEVLDPALVDLPALDEADAAAHGLLQAAHQVGVPLNGAEPLRTSVERVAAALVGLKRPLVLLLSSPVGGARALDRSGTLPRTLSFLESWFSDLQLSIAVIADTEHIPSLPPMKREPLAPAEARTSTLSEAEHWGDYSEAARALERVVPASLRPNPLKLRLAVGAVALGMSPSAAGQELLAGDNVLRLVETILHRSTDQGLQRAIGRFLVVRAPVPPEVVEKVVDPPRGHLALFTSCLGYGTSLIRISGVVRAAIQRFMATRDRSPGVQARREDLEEAHLALADYHQSCDGVADPMRSRSAVDWLEKLHHLGHAGPGAKARWEEQQVPLRELLWDRARALSIQARDHAGAAEVYERCVNLFPDDGYAWHYLGFNLDKAGIDPQRAEVALRRAVELESDNPWWNARRVTFLIGQARFREAEAAWQAALGQIDPTGEESVQRPELALHLHRWVIQAWLDLGEVARARAVFEQLPQSSRDLPDLAALELRLLDAEDTLALGESVRPSGMPWDLRWETQALPPVHRRSPLRAWYPGRVRAVRRNEVEIVFALPAADRDERMTFVKAFSRTEWRSMTDLPPERAEGRYFEMGEYGSGWIIRELPAHLDIPRPLEATALRYLQPGREP